MSFLTKGSSLNIHKNPLNHQTGGDHYKTMVIQPLEYAIFNKLGPGEHLVLKYISRDKNSRIEDLQKAIDVLEIMLEIEKGFDNWLSVLHERLRDFDQDNLKDSVIHD